VRHKRKKLKVQRNLNSLGAMRKEIRDFLRKGRLSWRDEARMVLAVDEAVSNIIIHNSSGAELPPIELELAHVDGAVEVVIRHSGGKFDPRGGKAARPERGDKHLGLYIISKAVDEVNYRFVGEECNELTFVKRTKER
jgi:anti-sigma regulatory factor (Ser/Thr protein kinase)